MINILIEETYLHGIWGQSLYLGLVRELQTKRLQCRRITSLAGLNKNNDDYVILISSSNQWIESRLDECSERHLHAIVLCNQALERQSADYSMVCSDVAGLMTHIVHVLERTGRNQIALYGVNPYSISDEGKQRSFLSIYGHSRTTDIFYNNGSLDHCFFQFIHCAANYDAVICMNGFVAISLVRHLQKFAPELLNDLIIISCAEVHLSRWYRNNIYSVFLNYNEFGRAAVQVLRILRNQNISSIIIKMKWECKDLDKLSHKKASSASFNKTALEADPNQNFYNDPELGSMMSIEQILNDADPVDLSLIQQMLNRSSYEEMAQRCFLGDSTIKYRIKKMEAVCKVGSKKELEDLLIKYLNYPN